MLIKIAWRNIWRNKKRSFIIMAAVTLGLWAGIFLMSFYNGMIEQRVNSAISGELSHIQLHHPDFQKDYDIKYPLHNGRKILQQITADNRVKWAAGRVILKGMIASASGSSGITINGVMPDKEKLLTNLSGKIKEGTYFNPQKTNEILLSEKISIKLKLKLNKKAILTFQDIEGNLVSSAFRVAAIYKTVNSPYDENNVFVNISDLDTLAGIHTEFNEIALMLNSNELLIQTESDIKSKFPETEVKNWMEISPEIGLTVSVGDQMVFVFMGIILLALAFGIINTMMMAVLERAREIGMLLALGMNKLKIFRMILMETFFLILAGCPAGIILAMISITLTRQTGISLSRFSEVYSNFGYSSVIYPSLTLRQFGIIMILVMVTALFSALFPARSALKLKPAEAIKKQ